MKPDVDKAQIDLYTILEKIRDKQDITEELRSLGHFFGEVDCLLSQLYYTGDKEILTHGMCIWTSVPPWLKTYHEVDEHGYAWFIAHKISLDYVEDKKETFMEYHADVFFRHPVTGKTVQEARSQS